MTICKSHVHKRQFTCNQFQKDKAFTFEITHIFLQIADKLLLCYQSGPAAYTAVGCLQVACKSWPMWQGPKALKVFWAFKALYETINWRQKIDYKNLLVKLPICLFDKFTEGIQFGERSWVVFARGIYEAYTKNRAMAKSVRFRHRGD